MGLLKKHPCPQESAWSNITAKRYESTPKGSRTILLWETYGSTCIKRETHIDVMSRANSGQEEPFEGLLELAADLLSSPNDDRHLRAFKVDLNTHGPGMS